MWRWARWVVSGVVILVPVSTAWVLHGIDREKDRELARFAAYDRQIEGLRGTYPVGTRRDVLEQKYQDHVQSYGDKDIYVLLGSDPSAEWYCSGWTSYADFKFDDSEDPASEKLIKIQRQRRGRDCL